MLGEINAYAYVAGNPVSSVDSTGFKEGPAVGRRAEMWVQMMFGKKKPFPQLEGLIATLFSIRFRDYDRQVAAMELGEYDEPIAEQALIHIGQRLDEPELISEACGTSIGDIWRQKGEFIHELAATLAPAAKRGLAEELKEDFPSELRKLEF